MNNTTGTTKSCNHCYVDLSKAELPIILTVTFLCNITALCILFKIKKMSEQINHYMVTKVTVNDTFSTSIFIIMWIGGWVDCGCLMTFVPCSILGWLATTSVVWSGWIVSIMSFLRYLATVKPIYYRTKMTSFRIHVVLYGTLVFTAIQLVIPFFGLVAPYQYYDDNFICAYNFAPGAGGIAHRVFLGFFGAEGMLVSITTLYLNIRVIYQMRKKNSMLTHESVQNSSRRSSEEKKNAFAGVTTVISAVCCVCYVPFLGRVLYDAIITNVPVQEQTYHSITMSLLFLAPLLNPIVYVVCNRSYRFYVLSVFKKLCSKRVTQPSNIIDLSEQKTPPTRTDTITTSTAIDIMSNRCTLQ